MYRQQVKINPTANPTHIDHHGHIHDDMIDD
jgi:hypothetical protein